MKGYVKKQTARLKKWGKKRYLSGTVPQNIAQVAKDVWYLKGLVNAEKHYHDYSTVTSATQAGVVINLSAIAQGDTETTRTGNSIFARSLYLQMAVNASTTPTYTQFRYMIFIDRNANPSSPPSAGSDILENTGSAYVTVSPLKFPEARNRFTILQDKHFTFSNTGSTAKYIKVYKKMRHHIKYVGTLGTDEGKGQIYMLLCSNDATYPPSVTLTSRLMYMDN